MDGLAAKINGSIGGSLYEKKIFNRHIDPFCNVYGGGIRSLDAGSRY